MLNVLRSNVMKGLQQPSGQVKTFSRVKVISSSNTILKKQSSLLSRILLGFRNWKILWSIWLATNSALNHTQASTQDSVISCLCLCLNTSNSICAYTDLKDRKESLTFSGVKEQKFQKYLSRILQLQFPKVLKEFAKKAHCRIFSKHQFSSRMFRRDQTLMNWRSI